MNVWKVSPLLDRSLLLLCPCFCCIICLLNVWAAGKKAGSIRWHEAKPTPLLPSDHASLRLYFRFPDVLSLDILSPSGEEQYLKCSGCWGRWMHSWKGGPRRWHRQTESAVFSPPPRSLREFIWHQPPPLRFPSKKTCSSYQIDFL